MGQAIGADDEETTVALHPAGEGVVALEVVGTGVLHILPGDDGAAGARGAEGVGDGDGEVGHRSGQPSRGKQWVVIVPATQRYRVVPRKAVLVDSPTAEPAHFAELVGVRVIEQRRHVVHRVHYAQLSAFRYRLASA